MNIKALTVQQPYAHYIIHGDKFGDRKDVENRTWSTKHRGPLLIHAGVGQDHIRRGNIAVSVRLDFGAIIGIVEVTECFGLVNYLDAPPAQVTLDRRWVEGPWCWCLAKPRPLAVPVPCRGKFGLWTPDAETMRVVTEQLGT